MRKAIVMNTGITEHKGKESLIHDGLNSPKPLSGKTLFSLFL